MSSIFKWLWRSFKLLIALGIFIFIWGLIEPSQLIVKQVDLILPRWRPAHDNFKVAVLSDLHIGSPFITLEKLRHIVELTNAQHPDLTVLLGDYVMGSMLFGGTFIEPEPIAAELQHLQAPHGVIAILGNHEWGYDGYRMWRALEQVGIKVLENQAIKIEPNGKPLWIVGLADKLTRRIDLANSLDQTEKYQPIILLSHNPDIFPRIPPRVTLTLSGHTHGGQINFPWLQQQVIPSHFGARYAKGHIVENQKDLFVSSGIGTTSVPLRIGIPPEIVILTLHSKN
jgi:predicted MPP superfamily phosphohydrolase